MEDIPGFSVKYDGHQRVLIENFFNLKESGTLVDCVLEVEGKRLNAHKVILSACSIYFSDLFNRHQGTIFKLSGVSFQDLAIGVEFIYKGEIEIPKDQLKNFINVAETLQIKGLFENNNCVSQNNLEEEQTKLDTSREGAQRPKLKKRKAREAQICESNSIYADQQERIVPVLEVTDFIDDTSCAAENLTQHDCFESLVIAEENEDDLQVVSTEDSDSSDLERTRSYHKRNVIESESESSESERKIAEENKDDLQAVSTEDSDSSDLERTRSYHKRNVIKSESESSVSERRIAKENKDDLQVVSTEDSDSLDLERTRSYHKRNVIESESQSSDMSNDNVNDCSLTDDLTKTKDVSSKNVSCRVESECSISRNRKVGRISDSDFTDVHQEEHDVQSLEVTRAADDKSYKSETLLIQGNSESLGRKAKTKKIVILYKKSSADSTAQNNPGLKESNILSCQQCGNVYKRKNSVQRHLKYECGKEPQFQCDICKKTMKLKRSLVAHLKIHEMKKKLNLVHRVEMFTNKTITLTH